MRKTSLQLLFALLCSGLLHAQGSTRVTMIYQGQQYSGSTPSSKITFGLAEVFVAKDREKHGFVFGIVGINPELIPIGPGIDTVGRTVLDVELLSPSATDKSGALNYAKAVRYVEVTSLPEEVSMEVEERNASGHMALTSIADTRRHEEPGVEKDGLMRLTLRIKYEERVAWCVVITDATDQHNERSQGMIVVCDK